MRKRLRLLIRAYVIDSFKPPMIVPAAVCFVFGFVGLGFLTGPDPDVSGAVGFLVISALALAILIAMGAYL